MAGSAFTPAADATLTDGGPEELVERLTREGLLPMREAAKLYGNKHKSTAVRHAMKGVRALDGRVIRLEAIRIGGALYTSKAAVLRFFAAQQSAPSEEAPKAPTPAARTRAANTAHDKLAELLGG